MKIPTIRGALRQAIRIASFFLRDPLLFLRYVGAGGIAAAVEFVLFTALYEFVGWPLLVANSGALAVAVVLCFILQRHWTFRSSGSANRQFRLYAVMQAVSAVLNNLLMLAFVNWLQLYAPVAKILQIMIVFVWNFSFCRLVVFVPAKSFAGAGECVPTAPQINTSSRGGSSGAE